MTSVRTAPFWDAVEGRAPLPPAAATLGLELIGADPEDGTVEIAFAATEAFTTPLGNVLEGFLAAMLHDTLGPALLATLQPTEFMSTLDLTTSFLRPAYPGRLVGRGRVVHRVGEIAFLEAELLDSDDHVVATGAATARVTELDPARSGGRESRNGGTTCATRSCLIGATPLVGRPISAMSFRPVRGLREWRQ
jgi:uncharacterized protein (TIGR00369 family)